MTDTAFYARAAATAARLLASKGAPVILRNLPINAAYDPATGTLSGGTPQTDTTLNGALFDFGEGQTLGPGGLIQAGDKKMLLEPGIVVPSLEDQVLDTNGVVYVIKGVGEVKPAGVVVLYELHLRK